MPKTFIESRKRTVEILRQHGVNILKMKYHIIPSSFLSLFTKRCGPKKLGYTVIHYFFCFLFLVVLFYI